MFFLRRHPLFFGFVIVIAALGAWIGARQAKQAGYTDGVVIAMQSAPATLDPRFATDATGTDLLDLISLPLVRLGPDGAPHPAAATFSRPNPTTYVFHLKPLFFHNGVMLNSRAVKDFYQSMADPHSASPYGALVRKIVTIETRGPNTIIFTLKQADPFGWVIFTRPLALVQGGMGLNPTGLGPYRVSSHTDQRIVLDSAPTWHGTPPTLPRLTFLVVKDPLVRLLKVIHGEADLTQGDMPASLYTYGVKHGLTGLEGEGDTYTYIGFNLHDKVAGNLAVRQALLYAIDRQTIINTLLNGKAAPADSLLPQGSPARWAAPLPAANPQKAAAILDKAGFTPDAHGVRLHLSLSTTASPGTLLLVQAIQQQLARAGIALDLRLSEWGTFYGNIKKGNFQSFLLSWVGVFQPDIYNTLFAGSMAPPDGANRGRYENPVVDGWLETMMHSENVKTRNKMARNVQRAVWHDLVYVPLWKPVRLALVSPQLTGYTLPVQGGFTGLLQARKLP